jgi:hypothetical protein
VYIIDYTPTHATTVAFSFLTSCHQDLTICVHDGIDRGLSIATVAIPRDVCEPRTRMSPLLYMCTPRHRVYKKPNLAWIEASCIASLTSTGPCGCSKSTLRSPKSNDINADASIGGTFGYPSRTSPLQGRSAGMLPAERELNQEPEAVDSQRPASNLHNESKKRSRSDRLRTWRLVMTTMLNAYGKFPEIVRLE